MGSDHEMGNEEYRALNNKPKGGGKKRIFPAYKLGEEVGGQGVRWFGQRCVIKRMTYGMFICPCGKTWQCAIGNIASGSVKSCGKCKKDL